MRARPWATLRAHREDGFSIIEMVVAIAIVSIVMAALTSLFANSIASAHRFGAEQTAISLMTSSLDNARSIGAVDARLGRKKVAVDAQFNSFAGTPVAEWLTGMDRSYSEAPYAADLPTQPIAEQVGAGTFNVNYFVGECHRKYTFSAASEECTNGPRDPQLTYIEFVRVVVAVTWKDARCDQGTCYRVSAVLLSGDADPRFSTNMGEPEKPVLSSCLTQRVVLGQNVNLPIISVVQPDEPVPMCQLKGGVPTFTWTASNLPAGLSVDSEEGTIVGTVTGPPGTVTSTITVTDVYGNKAAGNSFIWQVVDPGPTIESPGDQLAVIGTPLTLLLNSTCPSTSCTYTLDGFPNSIAPDPAGDPSASAAEPGWSISVDAETGVIAVAGAAPPFTATIENLTVTITSPTGKSAATDPFSWSFVGGASPQNPAGPTGPVITTPDDQRGVTEDPVSLPITADCGATGPCQFHMKGGPSGLSIDPHTGLISGKLNKTGTWTVLITVRDSAKPSVTSSTTINWTVT